MDRLRVLYKSICRMNSEIFLIFDFKEEIIDRVNLRIFSWISNIPIFTLFMKIIYKYISGIFQKNCLIYFFAIFPQKRQFRLENQNFIYRLLFGIFQKSPDWLFWRFFSKLKFGLENQNFKISRHSTYLWIDWEYCIKVYVMGIGSIYWVSILN